MPNERNTGKDWLNYLLLGLFLYLAYLPLSSFLFALKNDALTENFPQKYFFSAALHAGHGPLWNPYINFGLPLYADPGFAFWHPLTWLFGAIGYNAYILTVEILVFIWLGGIFMYRLGLFFGHTCRTAFLLALLYMCCGFFTGNLSHLNFLTCAAFLPLVTLTFLRLQTAFSPKGLLCCAFSIYLLAAGGHPAIPVATVYFLLFLVTGIVLTAKSASRLKTLKTTARTNLGLLLAVLGLMTPILLSWLEIWPHFNRSAPVFQPAQQDLGFTPSSYLSFLFPFATTAHSTAFADDLSMRNGYFSFIGLALFLVALFTKKNRFQRIFLVTGIVMLILSLGGAVKIFIYSHLPLLQYIRTNGEYRVFALFSFIIVLSWPLDTLLKERTPSPLFKKILAALAIGSLLTVTISLFFVRASRFPAGPTGFTTKIKLLLDTLPLSQRLLINAALLLSLLAAWYLLRKKLPPQRLIPAILMTDLLIFCWLQLPVTGVQRRSPADIDACFSAIPPGIPLPRLTPVAANDQPGAPLQKVIGCWSYYSKQPGTPELCDYPTLFERTESYFQSHWPDSINKRPFVFLCQTKTTPALTAFSPTQISIEAASPVPDTLVLLQNDFPGWQTLLDDHPVPHIRMYGAFMGIPSPGGLHHFRYRFTAPQIKWYLLVFLATAAMLTGWTFAKKTTRGPADR